MASWEAGYIQPSGESIYQHPFIIQLDNHIYGHERGQVHYHPFHYALKCSHLIPTQSAWAARHDRTPDRHPISYAVPNITTECSFSFASYVCPSM